MPDSVPTAQPLAQMKSGWASAIACIAFCAVSVHLLRAYSLLHWKILRDHYRTLEDPLKSELFQLLNLLEVYHVTALLAVGFGILTLRAKPEWLRLISIPCMIVALVIFFSLM